MKKKVGVSESVMSRYEPRSRDEMIELLDAAIARLPEASRSSARFEIDIENYSYDETDYPRLFIKYDRLETDEEEAKREAAEAQALAAQEARDKADFERLSAKFKGGGA